MGVDRPSFLSFIAFLLSVSHLLFGNGKTIERLDTIFIIHYYTLDTKYLFSMATNVKIVITFKA